MGHSGQLALEDFRWSVGQPGRSLLRVPKAPQPPATCAPQAGPQWASESPLVSQATIPPAPPRPPAPPWLPLSEELS